MTLEELETMIQSKSFCKKEIEDYLIANPDTKFKAALRIISSVVLGIAIYNDNDKKEFVCHFIDDKNESHDFKKQAAAGSYFYKVAFGAVDKEDELNETMYWEDFLSYVQNGVIKLIK